MNPSFDPERDLALSRVIPAPPDLVWGAWSDPRNLEQWWVPAPARCRVRSLELQAGGAFVTEYSEAGGAFGPHMDACFLAVEPQRRLVFTDTLRGGWRPAEQPFMTAVITFAAHPEGTDYRAHVMHRSGADRASHEEMGFFDGWGTVVEQLARFVEARR